MSAPTKTRAADAPPLHLLSEPGSEAYEAEIKHWMEYDPARANRRFRYIIEPVLRFGYRQRVYGLENIPDHGAFLMAANHASYMDPFFYARPHRRLVRYMAKASLMDMPVVAAVTRAGGGFPVRRGKGDMFAMDLAERLVHDGQPVCIFPEGTRYRTAPELGPSKSGAAIIAIKTGVSVIPAATWGSKAAATRGQPHFPLHWPRITTVFGPPISIGEGLTLERDDIERVRDEIWSEVHRMHELARTLHETKPVTFEIPGRS